MQMPMPPKIGRKLSISEYMRQRKEQAASQGGTPTGVTTPLTPGGAAAGGDSATSAPGGSGDKADVDAAGQNGGA